MMKLTKMISLMLLITLSACVREDAEPIHRNNTGLLYQVKFSSELYFEYTYNDLNQITEEKTKFRYTKHNYHNGKLTSSDFYMDSRILSSSSHVLQSAMNRTEWVNPSNTEKDNTKLYYHDNNGKIVKSEDHRGASEYSYDEKGRINRQTFFRENVRTGYKDYLYDNNDNLIKMLHYWSSGNEHAELQTTTAYEFDDKINPFKVFSDLMIPGRYTNSNNIVKETYTRHFEVDQSIENPQITENSYQYNSLGIPISKNDSEIYIYY